MNVPRTRGLSDGATVDKSDAVRVSLRSSKQTAESGAANAATSRPAVSREQKPETTDKVTLRLGKAVAEELSPQALLQERRAKVERIAALHAKGEYSVGSEDVAKSFITHVGEELMYQSEKNGPEAIK